LIIRPAKNILGSLRLPGDKSVCHRYAMLTALAQGTTRLANFSTGADCASSPGCSRIFPKEYYPGKPGAG